MYQTQADFEQHLLDTREALQLSSDAYDRGYKGEAKRLALAVRVLVHDTGASTSLLTHLGKKDIPFYATPNWPQMGGRNLLPNNTLVGVLNRGGADVDESLEYKPNLDSLDNVFPPRDLNFDEWWDDTAVVDAQGEAFARKQIVLTLANKDGGGHVDAELTRKYGALSRQNSFGWKVTVDGEQHDPPHGAHLAAMRQIAYEMTRTLDREFGRLDAK